MVALLHGPLLAEMLLAAGEPDSELVHFSQTGYPFAGMLPECPRYSKEKVIEAALTLEEVRKHRYEVNSVLAAETVESFFKPSVFDVFPYTTAPDLFALALSLQPM